MFLLASERNAAKVIFGSPVTSELRGHMLLLYMEKLIVLVESMPLKQLFKDLFEN